MLPVSVCTRVRVRVRISYSCTCAYIVQISWSRIFCTYIITQNSHTHTDALRAASIRYRKSNSARPMLWQWLCECVVITSFSLLEKKVVLIESLVIHVPIRALANRWWGVRWWLCRWYGVSHAQRSLPNRKLWSTDGECINTFAALTISGGCHPCVHTKYWVTTAQRRTGRWLWRRRWAWCSRRVSKDVPENWGEFRGGVSSISRELSSYMSGKSAEDREFWLIVR